MYSGRVLLPIMTGASLACVAVTVTSTQACSHTGVCGPDEEFVLTIRSRVGVKRTNYFDLARSLVDGEVMNWVFAPIAI